MKSQIHIAPPIDNAKFLAVFHDKELGLIPVEAEDLETFLIRLAIRGHEATGEIERNHRLRPELQGWPLIQGLIGPCWGGTRDGRPVIRYENHEAYNLLST